MRSFAEAAGIGRREAAVQQEGGVAHRAQQMLLGRNFAQVLVSRGADEAQMAMALDQTRHEELASPVDDLRRRAFARDAIGAGGHGLDAVAFDQDFAGIGGVVHAVPNHDVANEIGRLHRRLLQVLSAYGASDFL